MISKNINNDIKETCYAISIFAILMLVMSILLTPVRAASGIPNNSVRFITIGDPHLRELATDNENQRLTKAINYINNRSDVDFVVLMGDITNDGITEEFKLGKSMLSVLNKPYYVVEGNHDSYPNDLLFGNYFGPAENVVKINGYQLLFIGIWNEPTPGSPTGPMALHWSFNFNDSRIDSNMPTMVFLHGEVQGTPKGCCPDENGIMKNWNDNTKYYKYAWDMQPELNKFKKLIGVYSGHVHVDTTQTISTPSIYPVRYITIASFADNKKLGWLAPPSDNIGYSVVNNGTLKYNLVNYLTTVDNIPPTIHSVVLNNTTPNIGDVITVTVNTTDNMGITKVVANGTNLKSTGKDVWSGNITAEEGVHQVTVVAFDAAGNNITDYSASYATIIPQNGDIFAHYRGLGTSPSTVETTDLLTAANDWRDNIIPQGFSVSIATNELLTLANEWRNS